MSMMDRLGCFLGLAVFLALCMPLSASATELNFRSDTYLQGFQRDTATKSDAAVVPAYEYFQADIENPGEPGLSFHLYGWGRWDMADNNYFDDTTSGELLYGYLEYSGKQAHFNARLGRQQIFEGVANEVIDGLRVSSELGRYFSGSVYGGLPVSFEDSNGRSGDNIYGARLANHVSGWYDLGVSYKKVRSDSDTAEETTGVDLSAYLPYHTTLLGYSTYNLQSHEWGEHSYELHLPLGPVTLRPYFQKFQYKDYFSAGTGANTVNPFSLLAKSGEELTVLGTDLTLPVGDSWTLVGKVKHYDYEIQDDSSLYYGGQAIWSGQGSSQIGGELGYMNGNTDENRYYLVRLYTYWDQLPENLPIGFVSGDLVYAKYDQDIYGEDHSLFVSFGIGQKFLDDALELKLSGDYSKDPYFDKDVRGMLTISYRFSNKM